MIVKYPPQRLRVLDARPVGQLLIHEIYKSVQGESTFAGLPCVFVRTTGCGQRCSWCDTPHAFAEGEPMAPEAVLDRVRAFGCPLVEFTGGEPLLGADAADLVPFDAYASAADSLTVPSSAARAVDSGATHIERVDRLVQAVAAQRGHNMPALDALVAIVDARLEANRRRAGTA